MPSNDYQNPSARSERRIKTALASRAATYEERGFVSRTFHGAMQRLGRSSTQNFLKRQRNIINHPPAPSAPASEQNRFNTANEYISYFNQTRTQATELGNRGGAGDARRATNLEAVADTARGIQNAATAAELAEAAIAATGIGAVPAVIAAIPTEVIRQVAKVSATYLQGNVTGNFETAQASSEAAARATNSPAEEAYHNSSAAVHNNRRLQSAQRVDGGTATERSALRTQRRQLLMERGAALTDLVEEPKRNHAASLIARNYRAVISNRKVVKDVKDAAISESRNDAASKIAGNYRAVLSNRRLAKLQSSVVGAQEKAVRDKAHLEAADRGQQKRAQAIAQEYTQTVGPQGVISKARENIFGRKSTYTRLKEGAAAVNAATDGETATNALHSMGRTAAAYKPSFFGRVFGKQRGLATQQLGKKSGI